MAIGDVTIRTVRRRDGTSYQIYQGEYRDRNRAFVSDAPTSSDSTSDVSARRAGNVCCPSAVR